MTAETDFRALLANDAGVSALVGTRIARDAVPQASVLPLIVFASTHSYERGLDNTLHADQVTITVQCWAETSVAADAVADAVATAVASTAHVVTERTSGFDADLDLHATMLTVEWWP